MTIVDAAITILRQSQKSMTAAEIYEQIIVQKLYEFNSDKPIHILGTQLKRFTQGIEWTASAKKKFFKLIDGNKFELVNYTYKSIDDSLKKLHFLREEHERYNVDFKEKVLIKLKELTPATFEIFWKKLLEAYGFDEMKVTQVSNDGGIDGYGKLKVGLAHMNVAFQCKRWDGNVGRPEIDRFRGAIQGQYEQGIFFTTSSFTKQALEASIRPGAVPVILIDGKTIINLMIEKEFGIQVEYIKVYEYALDKEL